MVEIVRLAVRPVTGLVLYFGTVASFPLHGTGQYIMTGAFCGMLSVIFWGSANDS